MQLKIAILLLLVLQIDFSQSNCENSQNQKCYETFGQKLDIHQLKLIEFDLKLNQTIDSNNEFNQTGLIDENLIIFLTNLKQLKTHTAHTINADLNVLKYIQNIHTKQEEALEVLIDVLEVLEVTKSHLYDNIQNISGIQCLIDDTYSLFNNVKNMTIIAIEALGNAQNRSASSEVNSEEMSQLTKESIRIAEEIEDKSKEYIILSKDTRNISSNLEEMLLNIQNNQLNTNTNSNNLTIKFQNFEQELLKLQKLSEETLNKSQSLENQSLSNLDAIENIKLPFINKTDESINQIKAIMNETTTLLGLSNELIDKVQENVSEAEDILNEATKTQNKINNYFNKAKQYFNESEEAVNSGIETLKKAEDIYERLLGFNDIVQTTKLNSTKSLEGIVEIQELIDLVNKKAKTAQQSLNEAQTNIDDASNVVAQNVLPENIKETNDHYSQHIRDNIAKLNSKIENLTKNYTDQQLNVLKLEDDVRNETNLIETTKMQVANATNDIANVSLRLKESQVDLDEIIEELNDLELIDDGRLDAIEQKLNKYRMEHQEIRIQVENYKMEEDKYEKQYHLLYEQYQNDLTNLNAEVRQIELIYRDLPNYCLKDYVLEP